MTKIFLGTTNKVANANDVNEVIEEVTKPSFWQSIDWSNIFKKFLLALAIYIVGVYILKIITNVIKKIMDRRNINRSFTYFLVKSISFVYLFILIIIIAGNLGLNTSSLITLVGSFGIAIALALKESLQDLASGIMIVSINPLRVGDYVYIDDKDELLKVHSVKLFNTVFLNSSNYMISYPNSLIMKNKITNLSIMDSISCSINFEVPLDYDQDFIKSLGKKVLDNEKNIIHEKGYYLRLIEITDYSLKFAMGAQVKASDYIVTRANLIENMKKELDKNKIKVPRRRLVILNSDDKQ